MNKRQDWGAVLAALWLLLAPVSVAAQQGVEILVEGIAHDALFSIDFDDSARHAVAVGAVATVIESSDGGRTWTRTAAAPAGDHALLGIDLRGERRIAVGQSGLVVIKDGADGDWRKVDSGTDQRLLSVSANNKGLAFAVGAFGTVIRSTDGGQSWTPVQIDWTQWMTQAVVEPHMYDARVGEDGQVLLVGEFGTVIRSTDGGESWAQTHRADASLFSIDVGDQGVGMAVGQEGAAIKTTDWGQTWTPVDHGLGANLLGVYFGGDGLVVLAGMREMAISKDGGKRWRRLLDPEILTNWYSAVGPSADGGFVAVGQAGKIVHIPG
ncbi:MAG: WD40/YVTN/BNR-like repeat-containing protein [Panacagrimonas sp.]